MPLTGAVRIASWTSYDGVAPEDRGLRYGRVMIMTDQDHDGFHIKGLLVNLFHTCVLRAFACLRWVHV